MIRVFHDPDRDSIFISNQNQVFPDRSLVAQISSSEPNKIEVFIANGGRRVLGPIRYTEIQDINFNTFPTAQAVVDYLDLEFAKRDRDEPDDLEPFCFEQTTPASTWVVAHNLGRRPASIEVYVGACSVIANPVHITDNLLEVCFSAPYTGKVVIV